jgi:3-phosphoshikimate 1-carboxyvinyltransferase
MATGSRRSIDTVTPPARPPIDRPSSPLQGRIRDDALPHAALILGGLAVGRTILSGLAATDPLRATATALAALGVRVELDADGRWLIDGVGIGGLIEPDCVLDFGGDGAGCRLVMGTVATHPIRTIFTGDAALNDRSMRDLVAPLSRFGAEFAARPGDRMPMSVTGADNPLPLDYHVPAASSDVTWAILLAALNAPGRSAVIGTAAILDHAARLLQAFGAEISVTALPDGNHRAELTGQPELSPATLDLSAYQDTTP